MTGEQLKQQIKKAGISLAEVARILGIKPQTLQKRLQAKSVKSDFQEKVFRIIMETAQPEDAGLHIQQNNIGDNGLALAIGETKATQTKEKAYKSEIERLKGIVETKEEEISFLRKALLEAIAKIGSVS